MSARGFRKLPLGGWGRAPVEACWVRAPQRFEAMQEVVVRGDSASVIPRGLGRAYGDSALNREAGVLIQTSLHRFLAFDEATGVVECEAGTSFAELIEVFLPRGWFLPTTPGTKFVTVGGAIAADVHGKNHHADGSFGNFVESMTLLLGTGEVATCSPDDNPDLFWATVGGMGLTGIILSARIRLLRIQTSYFMVDHIKTKNIDETLEAFTSTNHRYRYSVAWIDCLATGRSLGRSVLKLANDGTVDELPERLRSRPLSLSTKLKKVVPFDFPSFALNPLSVRAFNTAYYAAQPDGQHVETYDAFFYPLDGILHWNRIYGSRGFVQYQALFPAATARQGLIDLLEAITASKRASFLAVLKACGPQGPGLLSYLHEGYTLALDFPHTGEDLYAFARHLDEILLRHGGRLYLAKDALMSKATFEAMYPRLGEFRAFKARVDPNYRFQSSQSKRLGLGPS